MDDRTRPSHAALNGLIFRHDDPFWDSHFPPCDFNCRCSVRGLRLRDIERRGLKVSDSADMLEATQINVGRETRPAIAFVDKTTKMRVVAGPGFGRRPIAAQQSLGEVLGQRIMRTPPEISAAVVSSMPRLADPLVQEYASWARKVLKTGRVQGASRVISTFSPNTVKALRRAQPSIQSAAVAVQDADLVRLERAARRTKQVALSRSQLLALPQQLAQSRAVLLDRQEGTLIYVLSTGGTDGARPTVQVQLASNGNNVRSAVVMGLNQLRDDRYTLLEGILE